MVKINFKVLFHDLQIFQILIYSQLFYKNKDFINDHSMTIVALQEPQLFLLF